MNQLNILIDYKVISSNIDCSIARKQNKVVQWFVKSLTIIIFEHILLFEDDFRFGTTTELSL